jgi:hypothetical protein
MKIIKIENKFYQEFKVVMVPTKNPNCLRKNQLWTHSNDRGKTVKLCGIFGTYQPVSPKELEGYCIPQELCFLSDEKIKEGDLFLRVHPTGFVIYESNEEEYISKCTGTYEVDSIKYSDKGYNFIHKKLCKKIVASTDKLNIHPNISDSYRAANCLPQIPVTFINYFYNQYIIGNIIDKVLVEVELYPINYSVSFLIFIDFTLDETNYPIIKLNESHEISNCLVELKKSNYTTEELLIFGREVYEKYTKNETMENFLDEWIKKRLNSYKKL